MKTGKLLHGESAVLLALGLLVCASTASAGVADSPLPVLVAGKLTKNVYMVPGVVKNNNLETVFTCTSLEAINTIRVGVEVFASGVVGGVGGPAGGPLNDAGAGAGAEDVGPGGTVTITTGFLAGVHEDEVINLAAASLRNGSARIISTSTKIACGAFVADELSDPPTSMLPLKVIKSKLQKGD